MCRSPSQATSSTAPPSEAKPRAPAPSSKSIYAIPTTPKDPSRALFFSIPIDPDLLRTFDETTQQTGILTHGLPYELQVGFSSDDKDLITIPFSY